MRVQDVGHTYEVDNMEGGFQIIQFIRKDNADEDGKLITMINGTTNEEILAVLIDRLEYLNGKMFSDHNVNAIASLKDALLALETRTIERKQAGIEGTNTVN